MYRNYLSVQAVAHAHCLVANGTKTNYTLIHLYGNKTMIHQVGFNTGDYYCRAAVKNYEY